MEKKYINNNIMQMSGTDSTIGERIYSSSLEIVMSLEEVGLKR